MRLAAQMRGGFYPAPDDAVAYAASFLCPPEGEPFAVLDPCAGEAAAIRQLGELLGCPQHLVYAIELDESRAHTAKQTLPEARVLAPASFFGCRISFGTFSFIWLNPPFDYGYCGYRMEDQFLQRATALLQPGGVMALVCPEDVADPYSDVCRHFTTYYQSCTVTPFPESCRHFDEVIVFGKKRARPQAEHRNPSSWDALQAPSGFLYHIPPGPGPRSFQKVEPTEPELQRLLAKSPLRMHLQVAPEVRAAFPASGLGHRPRRLTLGEASPRRRRPARRSSRLMWSVARPRKHEFVADVADALNDDGSVTTRTTISERIELVVRTVDGAGQIHTFGETVEEK